MANIRPTRILVFCLVTLLTTQGGAQKDLIDVEDVVAIVPFPSIKNTIINGESAAAGEFPFYAVFTGGVLCGAAVVHSDILVTAAHCVENEAPPTVRIGGTTLNSGEARTVQSAVIHPDYNGNTLANDIAVLVLTADTTAPIAPYNTADGTPEADADVTAMGFGRTSPNSGGSSGTLEKLTMQIIGDDECSDRYSDHDPDFNICADNLNGGICFGDSGGPLVSADGVVLGVASFIVQTCDSSFPDFYTRISTYSDWLEQTICEESATPGDNCDNLGDGGDNGCFLDPLLDLVGTLLECLGGLLG